MKIGIDARYLSHGLVGGVHTYVHYFLPELINIAADHTVRVYADSKRPFDLDTSAWPAHALLAVLPYKNGLSSVQHDLFMARQMAGDGVEVAHFPANIGVGPAKGATVLTLHDEINILPLHEIWRGHKKSIKTMATMTYLHAMSRMAVRKADVIVTVSNYSKSRIAEVGKIDPARIEVAGIAPSPDFRRIDNPEALSAVRARHALPARFVLADALKNPAALVRAWRRLPAALQQDRKIVFFARRPDVLPIVTEAVAAHEAVLLHRPSREDLIALYSMADAFVFPSWFEGFGLPLVEAMICGAPLVVSDRGSIPEVTGNAALIADAEDDAGIAAHLSRVLSDAQTAQTLRARGFARAGQFTWRKVAEKLLAAYETAHARCMPSPAAAASAEMP
jgi:glycosyltransferase involved in cell wall biosynthesis